MDGDLTLMASLNSQFFQVSPDSHVGACEGQTLDHKQTLESRVNIMAHLHIGASVPPWV